MNINNLKNRKNSMKQTTKNILGVAAIVLLSSGVAGLTTYKMLNKEKPAAFSELFQQNPCRERIRFMETGVSP